MAKLKKYVNGEWIELNKKEVEDYLSIYSKQADWDKKFFWCNGKRIPFSHFIKGERNDNI